MSSSLTWRHNDITIFDVTKQDIWGWRVNCYAPCQICDQRRKYDQKIIKKWLPYPDLAPYNTREEDPCRKTSAVHEKLEMSSTQKGFMPLSFSNFDFYDD